MSAWPGKYVIGLTGNIATGKSVVRKMLEHLGSYGIDADALGHRAIAKDAPGYQPTLGEFGKWILGPDGQIDRAKLARVVFNDPEAMKRLEAIVHPLVRQATDVLIRRAKEKVIVLEAIKLLESPLRQGCDAIWVTFSPPEVQLGRLMQKRGMTEDAALQRIKTQPSQEEKLSSADIIIRNDGSFENTWRQVSTFWQQELAAIVAFEPTPPLPVAVAGKGEMLVERARPRHASEIAALINRLSGGQRRLTHEDVMAAFGEKAFLFLKMDSKPVGLVGWQVENLVSRTDDVYLEAGLSLPKAMPLLMEEVERASRDLQCEASLLFLPPGLAQQAEVWRMIGYEPRTIQALGVRAWQEAAAEKAPSGQVMLFKQLRKDRVMRPI